MKRRMVTAWCWTVVCVLLLLWCIAGVAVNAKAGNAAIATAFAAIAAGYGCVLTLWIGRIVEES